MRVAVIVQVGLTQKLSDQVDLLLDLLSPSDTSDLEEATKKNVEATEDLSKVVRDSRS